MISTITKTPAIIERNSQIVEGADHIKNIWDSLIKLRNELDSDLKTINTSLASKANSSSLSGYSPTSHTHSNYAASNHTHAYVPVNGDTTKNNSLTVTNVLRAYSIDISSSQPTISIPAGVWGKNTLVISTHGYGHGFLMHEMAAVKAGQGFYDTRMSATMYNIATTAQVASSRKIKDNITYLEDASFFDRVHPVSFFYKEDAEGVDDFKKFRHSGERRKHWGFILEEVEETGIPTEESMTDSNAGNVRAIDMVAALWVKVKEQDKTIQDLKREVQILRAKMKQ